MKYVIYVVVALLVIWSVWFLVRHLKRQVKGDCSHCTGDCGSCHHGEKKEESS